METRTEKKQELNNNNIQEDNDEEVPGDIVEEVRKLPAKVPGDIVEEVRNMPAKSVMTLETMSHLRVVVILLVFFPLRPVVAQIWILVRGIAIR